MCESGLGGESQVEAGMPLSNPVDCLTKDECKYSLYRAGVFKLQKHTACRTDGSCPLGHEKLSSFSLH